MIELDRELFELKEKIMRKNKVEAMLESLKAELDQLKRKGISCASAPKKNRRTSTA